METNKNQETAETIKYGESANYPNAGKLTQSLRHLDYDNLSAINDLIDNSIDAGASTIWVDILPGSKGEIEKVVITDNGAGMDHATLNEALKLGSETGRNPACDLGLYGMGLITASISMGRRLDVVTKVPGGEVLIGTQDIDEIIERNAFVKTVDVVSQEKSRAIAMHLAEKFATAGINTPKGQLPNSFTIVTVSQIDRPQKAKAASLADDVRRRVAQVFRKFMQADKQFYINGQRIVPIDPIRDYEPTILAEDTIKLEHGDINIVVAELKDYGPEINKQKGLSISGQGFYILRNNREIAYNETLGLYTKHNDYNLLRIEFSYSGSLDDVLNTNFSKQRIRLEQSIEDKVEHICNPFIQQVRKNAKRKQAARRENKEDFTDIEKYITRKLHLLKNPKAEAEKHAPATKKSLKPEHHTDIEHPRVNLTKRQRINLEAMKVGFQQEHTGDKAPLWDSDQERDKVIVKWNVDHPFYQRVVAPNSEVPEVFNPLAYLIYCFASAELIAKEGSDSQVIIDNIRWDVGRNLAILLD